jgi:Polyketide cyclase / dehydrase and lipid transport
MESFVTYAENRMNPLKSACTPAAGLSRQPAGSGDDARLISFAPFAAESAKSDHSFIGTACPGSAVDMATVDVSVSSDLSPEKAWELASDLSRFDEWLTIFGGWKSPVPDQVEVGTTVSSAIKVKGFRNTIHWRVTRCDEPKAIELVGRGKPAVCIALRLCVKEIPGPSANVASGSSPSVASGSEFQVIADLTGGLLNTRVGNLVAKVLESDVRRSVTNLAALR